MAVRGPVPKRSEDRRRRNAPSGGGAGLVVGPAAAVVVAPEGDAAWHPVAARWYASLGESGQSRFYEPSDWATAFLMAESLSRDLNPQFVGFVQTSVGSTEAEYAVIPLKGASLSAYLKAMGSLLSTEGDRRRAGVELKRGMVVDPDEDAAVVLLDQYRADFGA